MASGTIKAVVSKSDIVDNLTTNDSTKVLSAAQGYSLNSNLANLVTNNTQSLYYDANGISAQITVPTGYVPFLAVPQEATASGAYLVNGSGGAYFCSCSAIANKSRNTRIYFIKV